MTTFQLCAMATCLFSATVGVLYENKQCNHEIKKFYPIGGSRGGREGRTPPPGVQILSISCSFRENLACSRPPWRVHAPPSGKSWIRHCIRFIFVNLLLYNSLIFKILFQLDRLIIKFVKSGIC